MHSWIDASLYPDTMPPSELRDLADRVDFLVRLCAAWDFGILPEEETVAEVRRGHWCEAVDACRFQTSWSYALLRRWHQLPPLPYLGDRIPAIADDPSLNKI